MWKANSYLPAGVSVYPRYDTQVISGSVTEVSFFPSSPGSRKDADTNYIANPFPGNKNIVLLGIALQPLLTVIKDDSANNIDAVSVVNTLFDSVIRLNANGGREQKILDPTMNYMNFANTGNSIAMMANTAPAYVSLSQLVIQSTGPRQLQNQFFFNKQESFEFKMEFPGQAGVTFPATADWGNSAQNGRGEFGVKAIFYCADMTNGQVEAYNSKLQAASLS